MGPSWFLRFSALSLLPPLQFPLASGHKHTIASMGARFGAILIFVFILFAGYDSSSANDNGGRGPGGIDPPIVVDAGWSATTTVPPAFFWGGPGTVFADDGPFTFTSASPTIVRITDDFCPGDRFRIYDNDVSLGETSDVETGGCVEQGPDAAFANPAYSSGSFLLGPGSHSITIQVIANPFSGGRGYIRVDLDTDVITTVVMNLNFPFGVAVDNGNVYIADRNSHKVWKLSGGVLTAVAGTGAPGYNGDGISATAAQLNSPTGVARDASRNLYIADSDNHIIRKVAPDGIISTVAGTPQMLGLAVNGGLATDPSCGASPAPPCPTLYGPRGVAVDAAIPANIYIADTMNYQIRKVAAGIITAVAGVAGQTGSNDGPATGAKLNSPLGVAVNASGSVVYVADEGNHKVRKVDVTLGEVTTVAGTGISGFSGDNGLATAANLDSPSGVALDAAGNLYIADTDNHQIRRVSSAGVITTVAGTGVPGSLGDGGPATAAQLSSPVAVAVDGAGDLYIADLQNQRIRKVDFTP